MSHVFERFSKCLRPLDDFPIEAVPVVIQAGKAILTGGTIADKKAASLCAATLSWYPLQLWLEKDDVEGLGAKSAAPLPEGDALLQAGIDELERTKGMKAGAKGAGMEAINWGLIFAFAKKIMDILGPFLS